jgi:pilus assembly protein CpaB
MSRQTRLLVVVVVAVVVGGLASFGVYYAVAVRPPEVVQPPSTVIVASRALDIGTSLTKDDVRIAPWPDEHPVKGSYAKLEDVLNRGLIAAVVENEPITAPKLAPAEAGAGLPPTIKPGMRAMSVRVNDVIGVAGFVVPGTKVDVLVTVDRDGSTRTRTVLSNVQVLTAGTRYDEATAKQEGKPIPSGVVTLMVTPAEAERITLAQAEGQIMLALRNPLDTEQTRTSGISSAALLDAPAGAAVPAPAPPPTSARAAVVRRPAPEPAATPPPPPKAWTVELIKAGKREEETLR